MIQVKLPPQLYQALHKLDAFRLVDVLQSGDIKLVRTSWLLAQEADFRMPWRQKLEAAAAEAQDLLSSPLLSPQEAVDLLRCGNRSIGVLSYGWLLPGNPDPRGERIATLRQALQERPYLQAVFWGNHARTQTLDSPPPCV